MKLYTESLWAAGRGLMKDSVTVERITNTRLLDTVHYTHTHIPAAMQCMHIHKVDKHIHTLSRYSPDFRANGSWS